MAEEKNMIKSKFHAALEGICLKFSWFIAPLLAGIKNFKRKINQNIWCTRTASVSDPDSFFTDPEFFSKSGSGWRQQKTNFFKAKTKFGRNFCCQPKK